MYNGVHNYNKHKFEVSGDNVTDFSNFVSNLMPFQFSLYNFEIQLLQFNFQILIYVTGAH